MPLWADQLIQQFLMKRFNTLITQCRHIEHMFEGVWVKKIFEKKKVSFETLDLIFACVMIVHIPAD